MQAAPVFAVGTSLLVALTICAFAANSVLCRLALGGGLIDAASFTSLRLASGAVVLAVLLAWRGQLARPALDARAALALFAYAICFSYAYLSLPAGTGALLLFCAVQLTMLGAGLARGERPPAQGWLGIAAALGGLVYLLAPGIHAPEPGAALAMSVAGMAWGVYSLLGTARTDPVAATAWNFIAATPLALGASLAASDGMHVAPAGAAWAMVSGAVTSGLGYVVWYRVLPRLTTTVAAAVQVSVPVVAAFGGVWFLGERLTARLAVASVVILGGIGLVIGARRRGGGSG